MGGVGTLYNERCAPRERKGGAAHTWVALGSGRGPKEVARVKGTQPKFYF